jgi:hypothetical protein
VRVDLDNVASLKHVDPSLWSHRVFDRSGIPAIHRAIRAGAHGHRPVAPAANEDSHTIFVRQLAHGFGLLYFERQPRVCW